MAGWEKEGELATMFLEFEYLCQKSCCKMLIGGDDIVMTLLPLARACFCFTLIGRNLTAQSMGSDRGIGGGV